MIDLGNNCRRFDLWEAHINWQDIFRAPNSYIDGLYSDEEIEKEFVYEMPDSVRALFSKYKGEDFHMKKEYFSITKAGGRPKLAVENSIKQHTEMVVSNSEELWDGLDLIKDLENDIEYRVRQYSYCISKTTENYLTWLQQDYRRKLEVSVRRAFGY